jgi:hypothetical protein
MGMEKHFDNLVAEFEEKHDTDLGIYKFGRSEDVSTVEFKQDVPDEFIKFIKGEGGFNPKRISGRTIALRDMPEYGGPKFDESKVKGMVDKLLGESEDDETRVEFDFIKFRVSDVKSIAKGLEEKFGISTDMAGCVAISILYHMQIQGKDADATARSLMEAPFDDIEQAKEAVALYTPEEHEEAETEEEEHEEHETEEHEEEETEEEEAEEHEAE